VVEARSFGLIGDPVDHSLSPAMHRAGFAALGVTASYALVRVPAEESASVETEMRRLASSGGGNVTVPHKAVAARALDRPSETVASLGACNCFWGDRGGAVAGDNTDVEGIRMALSARLSRPPVRVLILGAGGSAAAAGLAVLELGASSVSICNRTQKRAQDLAINLAGRGVPVSELRGTPSGDYDVVINATSLGLRDGDPLPARFDRLSAALVLDLVYGPRRTAWTLAAEAAGSGWVDGREVLLHQGAACYPHWFGAEAPVPAMRSALFGDDA